MTEPEWIDREGLDARLAEDVAKLAGDDLAWWSVHRVEPRVIHYEGRAHFAIAETGQRLLIFFDDEDEFGVLTVTLGGHFGGYGLCGDLVDAVRNLRQE